MKIALGAMSLILCGATFASQQTGFFLTHRPEFYPGSEFPGASGALRVEKGYLLLDFDFSKGGHYVAARVRDIPARPVVREVEYEADCPAGASVTLRFTDATGQTFQRALAGDTDGLEPFAAAVENEKVRWGGANDGVFHQPLRGLMVIADNRTPGRAGGAKGTLRFRFRQFREQPADVRLAKRRPARDLGSVVDEAGRLRDELVAELPALERRGLGAKTRATVAVMNDFFPWLLTDVARGFTNRALRASWELVDIGLAAKERLERVRAGLEWDRPVPHFVTGPTETSRAQIVGTREWPDGRRERGNVFLTGFGHFGMIQRELAKMPPLGNHILQMEIGPRSFLPEENVVNTNAIRPFVETAARAAKENVQICFLLSPHYFPEWALRKWPHLKDCACGFFRFCVYDENARAVIEKSLRTAIPLLRGNPALHSLCLSNEPVSGNFGKCRMVAREWPKWLARTFGSVERMNAEWKTAYASFADVAAPSNAAALTASPESVEFVRFNRRAFADFHAWMAGVIRGLAPEIPLHAKIMAVSALKRGDAYASVDVEQFSEFSDYNGNDAWDYPLAGDPSGWAHDWSGIEAAYDFQRSAKDVPVFNAENHNIRDRDRTPVGGDHVYTVLWQNAVHGQSATTEWLWERAYDDGKSDANGLFLERPACLEAWAHCALDLNRLADELAPVQNLAPTVLLHFSTSSQMRAGRRGERFLKWYRAANWLGQPLGVASEKMLADYGRGGERKRPLDSARALLLPDDGFIPAEVQKGIDRLAAEGVCVVRGIRLGEADLATKFESLSRSWNLPDLPRVTTSDGSSGVNGVESRGYRREGFSYVTFVNHRNAPRRVRLERPGVDLITGAKVPEVFDLPPLKPMFVKYSSAAADDPLANARLSELGRIGREFPPVPSYDERERTFYARDGLDSGLFGPVSLSEEAEL